LLRRFAAADDDRKPVGKALSSSGQLNRRLDINYSIPFRDLSLSEVTPYVP